MHPRNYGGAFFEMVSGTDSFAFRQNSTHGGSPIAIFNSSTKPCKFSGNVEIPNYYSGTSIDTMISSVYNVVYLKAKVDTLFCNIDLSSYYHKTDSTIIIYRFRTH